MPGAACGVIDTLGVLPLELIPGPRGCVIAAGQDGVALLDPCALVPPSAGAGRYTPRDGYAYPIGYHRVLDPLGAAWLPEAGLVALAGSRGVQLLSDPVRRRGGWPPPHTPLATLDAHERFGLSALDGVSVHLAAGHGDAAMLVHIGGSVIDEGSEIFVIAESCACAAGGVECIRV